MYLKIKYRLKTGLLVFIIAFCCCCAPAWVAAKTQELVVFEDLTQHWAQSSVSRLAVLELVEGYPDATFKPDQPLNRLETVVLVMRSGGFTAEAEKAAAARNKKNAVPLTQPTPPVPWGQPYIDLAIEKGFLVLPDPDNYEHAGPATRLEMAELLARAMYLVPPALDSDPAEVEEPIVVDVGTGVFSDLNRLEPMEQAIVAAVVQAEIMSGYPDGTFRPQASLTRAEAAEILSRLVDSGWVKVAAERRLNGWVAGVEEKKNYFEIAFNTLSGTQKLKARTDIQCFKAGEPMNLAGALNFQCEVVLDGRKQAAWINLLESKGGLAAAEKKVRASVKTVALGEDNLMVVSDMELNDLVLPISWDAVVNGKKAKKGFQSLKAGDFVDIQLQEGQVKEVTLLEVKTMTGKVYKVEGSRLYLKESSPTATKPAWFNYYDSARLLNKNGSYLEEIRAGDSVKITYIDHIPGEIDDEQAVEIRLTK